MGAWIAASVLTLLIPLPIIVILVLRFVPVPFTPQMLGDLVTGNAVHYRWVSYNHISYTLVRAVIASEDENFCSHHGFDWRSIDKAIAAHDKGKRLRGASTISQQTARSVFLAPVRSWVRKGVEAWLTVLIEELWPKERILTVYLNVVDWGHGNFGAEAAARDYFHKPASTLSDLPGGAPCRHPARPRRMEGRPSGPLRCEPCRHTAGPHGGCDPRRSRRLRAKVAKPRLTKVR